MTFHTLDYCLFFAVVFLTYWLLGRKSQNALILGASYFFYGYVHHWFLILIATSTIVDYFCARGMERSHNRKLLLYLSILTNLGMLGLFKYYDFFAANINTLLGEIGFSDSLSTLHFILPVGISFYTFQTMSYTIDVYRGKYQATRNFLDFAVFVSFFPQLVAGPIERAPQLLPQIESKRNFSMRNLEDGVTLMIWGFFKKLVIADNVGRMANMVFSLREPSFFLLWAGVFAFCIQIYSDFSAYTDIARGTARTVGFNLIQNFDHPYLSSSPSEFWKRWHISLSYWIRDYIYIPLGSSHARSYIRNSAILIVTFGLCGLWHGASWNYVLWGLYHAVLIILYRAAGRVFPSSNTNNIFLSVAKVALMFVFINIGWLIFRETNLAYLLNDLLLVPFAGSAEHLISARYIVWQTALYSIPLFVHSMMYLIKHNRPEWALFSATNWRNLRALTTGLLVTGILLFFSDSPQDFIYFQF